MRGVTGLRVAVIVLCALSAHQAAGQGAGGVLLVGTDGDDILTGGPGDDTLDPRTASLSGQDLVQGGAGNDVLALAGAPLDYVFVAESTGFRVTGPSLVNALVEGVERVAFGVTGDQLFGGATPLTIAESAALLPGSSADGIGRRPIALSDTVGGARGGSRVLIDLRDLLRNDYDPDFDAQDLTGVDVAFAAPVAAVNVLLDPVAIVEAGYESALYPFGLLVVDLASPLTSDVTLRYRTQMTLQGTSFTDQSSEATVTITPVAAANDRIIGSFGGETFVPYARLLANDGPGAAFAGLFNPYVFGGTIVDDPARGGIVIDFPGFFRNDAFFEYAIAGSPDHASVEVELSNSPPIATAIARVVTPGTSFTLTFDAIREHFGNFDPDSGNFLVDITGPANTNGVTFQILADRVELSFPAGYAGDFVLDYTLSDQPLNARSLPGTISFLTAAPPAPVAADDVLNWGINSDGRTLFQGGQPGYGVIYSRELLANDTAMPGSVVVASFPRDTTPLNENLAIQAIQYAIPGFDGVTSRSDTSFGFEFNDDFTGSDTYAYTVVDPLGRTATGLITLNVDIPQPMLANNVITIPIGATSVTVTAADILANDTFSGTGAIAQINANAVIQVVDSGVSIGGGKTRLDGFTFDLDPTRSLDSYQFNVLAFDTLASGGSASGWQTVSFERERTAPPVVAFESTNAGAIGEGGLHQIRIVRTGDLSAATTVTFAIQGGTSTTDDIGLVRGTDHVNGGFATLGTGFGTYSLTFNPGVDYVLLAVASAQDGTVEPDETFVLELLSATSSTIANASRTATATILNDDISEIGFDPAASVTRAPEGNGQTGGALRFVIRRTGDVSRPTTMLIEVSIPPGAGEPQGTTTGDDLYMVADGALALGTGIGIYSVTFAPGEAEHTIVLVARGDRVQELDESFRIAFNEVESPSASLPLIMEGTFLNDDVYPELSLLPAGPVTVAEGNGEGSNGVVSTTIGRTGDLSYATTVTFVVAGFHLTTSDDLGVVAVGGTSVGTGFGTYSVSFAAGEAERTLVVTAAGDTVPEPDDRFTITLIGATFGNLSSPPPSILATIVNDDQAPLCATNVSSVVSVTRGTIRYVRARARFEQVLTLTNIGTAAIAAPVALAVDGLPARAGVAEADGVTACAAPAGSPFEMVPVGSDNVLSPGETASIVVAFTTTQNQSFTYTTRVLAGTSR